VLEPASAPLCGRGRARRTDPRCRGRDASDRSRRRPGIRRGVRARSGVLTRAASPLRVDPDRDAAVMRARSRGVLRKAIRPVSTPGRRSGWDGRGTSRSADAAPTHVLVIAESAFCSQRRRRFEARSRVDTRRDRLRRGELLTATADPKTRASRMTARCGGTASACLHPDAPEPVCGGTF
jgi:hypothetical protein